MGASSPLASLSIIGKWTVFSSQWFLRFWLKVLLLALIIICSSCLGPCEVITTGQGRSLSHPAPWETLIWFNPICSWHLNNTVWSTRVRLVMDFFSSKYCRTTWSVAGWVHGCGTVDMGKGVYRGANYKLRTDFLVCGKSMALMPVLLQGQ